MGAQLGVPLLGGRVHPPWPGPWYLHSARELSLQKSFVSRLLKWQIRKLGKIAE